MRKNAASNGFICITFYPLVVEELGEIVNDSCLPVQGPLLAGEGPAGIRGTCFEWRHASRAGCLVPRAAVVWIAYLSESVKDLESLTHERHRFINRPANSLALVVEESPVLCLPMR